MADICLQLDNIFWERDSDGDLRPRCNPLPVTNIPVISSEQYPSDRHKKCDLFKASLSTGASTPTSTTQTSPFKASISTGIKK